jgi:hypothetical protein
MQSYHTVAKLPSLTTQASNMAINQINHTAVTKLCRVAEWMEDNSARQSDIISQKFDEKTRGNKIQLLAYFPKSKPFWDDSSQKLQCFACNFLPETSNCNRDIPDKQTWMTKRIQKGDKTHIVAFCLLRSMYLQ